MGSIRFRLGAFVVQVQALEVELADQALQLLVVIVFAAGCIQFQVTGSVCMAAAAFLKRSMQSILVTPYYYAVFSKC